MTNDLLNHTLNDRYRLRRIIGRGGMATVYAAEDLNFRGAVKLVAVKVLNPDLGRDEDQLKKFQAEAHLVAGLDNPHIVNVTDHGVTREGIPYLVMPLLKGSDLHQALQELGQPMPWPRVVKIAIQLCDALAVAHEAGVVHRDVKPSNCFLEESRAHDGDFVKLLDLGVAKVVDEARRRKLSLVETLRSKGAVGTLQYISPEQAKGEPVDHRADFYSLGVMLYRMLTGVLPFVPAPDAGPLAILHMHIGATPRPMRELNPSIPETLESIVDISMSKSPVARWESADALMTALKQTLAPGEELPSRPDDSFSGETIFVRRRGSLSRPLFFAATIMGGLSMSTAAFMLFAVTGVEAVASVGAQPMQDSKIIDAPDEADPSQDHASKHTGEHSPTTSNLPAPEPASTAVPANPPDSSGSNSTAPTSIEPEAPPPEPEPPPEPAPPEPPTPTIRTLPLDQQVQKAFRRSLFDECRPFSSVKTQMVVDVSVSSAGAVTDAMVHPQKTTSELVRNCVRTKLLKVRLSRPEEATVIKDIKVSL